MASALKVASLVAALLNGCQMPRLTRQSSLNNHKCPDQVRHDDAVC